MWESVYALPLQLDLLPGHERSTCWMHIYRICICARDVLGTVGNEELA